MNKRYRDKIKIYNQPTPLQPYLVKLIGNKKEVRIADLGSGPFSTTGQILEGVKVEVYPSDKRGHDNFWANYGATPYFKIEVQDMEKLTYADDFFDIVHCENALDHTKNIKAALLEMIRVCKPDGTVYIHLWLDQKTTSGGWHYWDAKEDGRLVNDKETVDLKDYGFKIEFLDIDAPRRYKQIIATLQK